MRADCVLYVWTKQFSFLETPQNLHTADETYDTTTNIIVVELIAFRETESFEPMYQSEVNSALESLNNSEASIMHGLKYEGHMFYSNCLIYSPPTTTSTAINISYILPLPEHKK